MFRPEQESGPVNQLLVKDVIALYLRHCAAEGTHGPAARADRAFTFKLFAEACGHLAVAEARPFHLTDFIEAHPEWKSVSTRRAKSNAIRACFNWAARQERIPKNPFRSVQYAEHERREEMPDAALDRLEKVSNKAFEVVLRFLRLTGCRTGELCAATWADVDLDRGVWIVQRHKSRRFTGKPKVVALVAEAVALLRGLPVRVEVGAGVAGAAAGLVLASPVLPKPAVAADPVFLNTRGGAWSPGVLGYQLRRLKKRHGIQSAGCLHGIRHRLASAMMESGATPKEAAEQLGHTTSVITERYYFHRSEKFTDAIRAAVERATPKRNDSDR